MEALSQFFIGSLVNSGVHLGRIVRKSVRTFSRNVYFVRKKISYNKYFTYVIIIETSYSFIRNSFFFSW